MRLWSIHPRHLDRMGLLGLWREALQAQRILIGGPPYKVPYGNHPQLERFKRHSTPVKAIGFYLKKVYEEGRRRGYKFNYDLLKYKPHWVNGVILPQGQFDYEMRLLLYKLKGRDKDKWNQVFKEISIATDNVGLLDQAAVQMWLKTQMMHPLFHMDMRDKSPATWERVKEF